MTTINGLSSPLRLQEIQASPQREFSVTEVGGGGGFGPSFELSLSPEAVQAMNVAETNLSEKQIKDLDALFGQIDKLFETAGDKPLTAAQEKQLTALEKKVDGILGPPVDDFDFFAGLNDKEIKELDALFGQIDKIFETAGDKPLTAAQEKQLTALEKKVDGILGPPIDDFDFFAGLNDKEIKDLDALLGQIDKIFESAGDKPLTAAQEKQLTALEKKVDGILGPPIDDFDFFEGLNDKEIKDLDALFGQIDKLFESAGDKPLTSAQEKLLTALSEKISNIVADFA